MQLEKIPQKETETNNIKRLAELEKIQYFYKRFIFVQNLSLQFTLPNTQPSYPNVNVKISTQCLLSHEISSDELNEQKVIELIEIIHKWNCVTKNSLSSNTMA